MTAPLDRFFARLPGAWSVARTIDDDRMGAGRFDGEALLTPQSETALLYEENGELVIGTWRGPAYRRWLYVRESGVLTILYPDGQTLLHRFDFSAHASRAAHTHLCGEDRYHAVFTLSGEGGFTLDYAVDGPAKRYRLSSTYARIEARQSNPARRNSRHLDNRIHFYTIVRPR